MKYKNILATVTGVIGGAVASYLGDFTMGMSVLFTFMIADYVLGLIGAIILKSTKTENGGLSSKVGFIGLARKLTIIVFIGIGYNLDLLLQTNIIKEMVIIGFSTNELISITEHAGVIGVPLPPIMTKAIEILNDKGSDEISNQT